jgi:tetratricopeptide (TPR) repeat protein
MKRRKRFMHSVSVDSNRPNGPIHPKTLEGVWHMILGLRERGRQRDLAAAKDYQKRALEGCKNLLDAIGPDVLVDDPQGGNTVRNSVSYAVALEECQQILDVDIERSMIFLGQIGEILTFEGRYVEAERMFLLKLSSHQPTHGPSLDHTEMTQLAYALEKQEKFEESIPLLEEYVAECKEDVGLDIRCMLVGMERLVFFNSMKGDYDTAKGLIECVLAKTEQLRGRDSQKHCSVFCK